MRGGAAKLDLLCRRLASSCRQRNAQLVGQIAASERSGDLAKLVVTAGAHYPAAVFPRAGTEVKDAIRCAHDLAIMLYHQHGVAQIAQLMQDANQARGVAT